MKYIISAISVLTILLLQTEGTQAQNYSIKPEAVIHTYLGNEARNYYGNKAPDKLNLIWKHELGSGMSPAYGKDKIWAGAGWTGQPLFIREGQKDFLIIGAFDYHLKKINAETGKLVWQYKFDDILKGTGTFFINKNAKKIEEKYIIIQGSRRGVTKKINDRYTPSLRAVSYLTGKELWRMNVTQTDSYSRDVDGSALVVDDTAYLALENGLFTVFNPDPAKQELLDDMKQPKIYKQLKYYTPADIELHGDDLVSESSPTLAGNMIYTTAGSGHVYGYNRETGKNTFDLYIGTDLNGSAPLTDDSCLIIPVEKQYTDGPGGVMKIDPTKPGEKSIIWFYPTPNKKWYHWKGGIIGSACINDAYAEGDEKRIAAFIDVNGWLFVVDHKKIDPNFYSTAPDGFSALPVPELLFKEKIAGTISTPIIVKDKLIAATDDGLFLYKIDLKKNKLTLLDSVPDLEIDATPIAVDGKIYIGVRDGFLYCFGN